MNRDEFMELVYETFADEPDNVFANGIIEAADAYVEYEKAQYSQTAQPERKKGKWVHNSPVTMKCNLCGLVIKDWDWHRFKICPNCGADMRGERNG